jgi:ribonucleoside-diphosphate reductase alpha chain
MNNIKGHKPDKMELSENTIAVLEKRYLKKDDAGNVIETPVELFRRVAGHVSGAEQEFGTSAKKRESEEKFYSMMKNLDFLPNSPTLMNAGTSFGQLSACFVLPVEDSVAGIFSSLRDMANIHQTGGGTGFSFSRLRPKGDLVRTTKGEASGPLSFMTVFDQATAVIVQGGRRRGANMGILRCDHPDIMEFVKAKENKRMFSNFNLSVGATDAFMKAAVNRADFSLINPRTREKTGTINAGVLLDRIVEAAHCTGDPGLVFLDEINRRHPVPGAGTIEATNPCGELPLLPYESCNLASINLSNMVRNGRLDLEKLKNTVKWGIRFLDNVIEVNNFPLRNIEDITKANRKVGLGVMGLADMLVKLGIPYTSRKALWTAGKIMKIFRATSVEASSELAALRGTFPNYDKSIYAVKGLEMRNATVNTIAPTGTISIIAGCSSGIEPLFAVSFVRTVLSGTKLFETNPVFESTAKERGFYSTELLNEISKRGSLAGIERIPKDVRDLFKTAFDVPPEQHLKIQAAFQKYTDNSVSKTINLPSTSSPEDIREIYIKAHKFKCKGITVYRYGSKEDQVLTFGAGENGKEQKDKRLDASEFSRGCPGSPCMF